MSTLAKKVRYYLKNSYPKPDKCYICGATTDLEIHHIYSIAQLSAKVSKEINSELPKEIVAHEKEKFMDFVVLCKTHHKMIHDIFGKDYALEKSENVKKFIEKRRINQ